MFVKVFTTNEKGKIEFTRCELEKLLDEVYKKGEEVGHDAAYKSNQLTWTSPYIAPTLYGSDTTNSTHISGALDTATDRVDTKCNCGNDCKCADTTNSISHKELAKTVINKAAAGTAITPTKSNITVTVNGTPITDEKLHGALKDLANQVQSLTGHNISFDDYFSTSTSTPFTNLAKELYGL